MNVRYFPEAKVSSVVYLIGTDEDDAIARAQRGLFFHDVSEAIMECETRVNDDLVVFESVSETTVISAKLVEYR